MPASTRKGCGSYQIRGLPYMRRWLDRAMVARNARSTNCGSTLRPRSSVGVSSSSGAPASVTSSSQLSSARRRGSIARFVATIKRAGVRGSGTAATPCRCRNRPQSFCSSSGLVSVPSTCAVRTARRRAGPRPTTRILVSSMKKFAPFWAGALERAGPADSNLLTRGKGLDTADLPIVLDLDHPLRVLNDACPPLVQEMLRHWKCDHLRSTQERFGDVHVIRGDLVVRSSPQRIRG